MDAREQTQVLDLYRQGMSAAKIVERLGLSVSPRSVQRFVKAQGLRTVRVTVGRRSGDRISGPLRSIIEQQLLARGDDPYVCAICGDKQEAKCDIHHKKYAGASIDDLAYVCRSCNLSGMSSGLE